MLSTKISFLFYYLQRFFDRELSFIIKKYINIKFVHPQLTTSRTKLNIKRNEQTNKFM